MGKLGGRQPNLPNPVLALRNTRYDIAQEARAIKSVNHETKGIIMNVEQMLVLAQAQDDQVGGAAGAAGAICAMLFYLVLLALIIVGGWKCFAKAGKPGWAFIIPIYNYVVALEIVGRPIWWIVVLLLVPCVNVVFLIILAVDFAKAFGKGPGFGIGLILLPFIFFPLLGFGDARYLGPVAAGSKF